MIIENGPLNTCTRDAIARVAISILNIATASTVVGEIGVSEASSRVRLSDETIILAFDLYQDLEE